MRQIGGPTPRALNTCLMGRQQPVEFPDERQHFLRRVFLQTAGLSAN